MAAMVRALGTKVDPGTSTGPCLVGAVAHAMEARALGTKVDPGTIAGPGLVGAVANAMEAKGMTMVPLAAWHKDPVIRIQLQLSRALVTLHP